MAVIAMSPQFGHYGLRRKTNWWDNFKKSLNNSMGYLLSHFRSRYLISLMFPTPVGRANDFKALVERNGRLKKRMEKDGIDGIDGMRGPHGSSISALTLDRAGADIESGVRPSPRGLTLGRGKVRVLAIRDRVVQGALKLILEPIFEADFQPGSFGYRPN
jgi:hypothetical protein